MWMGGSTGPGPPQLTDAGSGMEMEEGGAEEEEEGGGGRPAMLPDAGGGGPAAGRTALKGWAAKGG